MMKKLLTILLLACGAALGQNPTITFTASASPVTPGTGVTLTWSSNCPASACAYSIDQGIGSVSASGTTTVNPTSTTTYSFQNNNSVSTTMTQLTSGSMNIVVASNANIVNGQSVLATTGIASNTTVTNISGTTITISQATTAVISGTPVTFGTGLFQKSVTVIVGNNTLSGVTQTNSPASGGSGCPTELSVGKVCEITYDYPGSGCNLYNPPSTGCTGGTVTNPNEQVFITTTFTGQNTSTVVTAQGFYAGGVNSSDGNAWKVRFAPQVADIWNVTTIFSGPSDYTTFTNTALFNSVVGNGGFLARNSGVNARMLFRGDGTPFWMEGINLGTTKDLGGNVVSPETTYTADYGGTPLPNTGNLKANVNPYTTLGTLAQSGINFIRMNAGFGGFEVISSLGVNNNVYFAGNTTNGGTVGVITLDTIAQQINIAGLRMLCNPSNTPQSWINNWNFFNNTATSREFFHFWQHEVNRLGAYCDIWETGNEINPTPSYFQSLAYWIKSIDPYQHLVSITFPTGSNIPLVDLPDSHLYANEPILPALSAVTDYYGQVTTLQSSYSGVILIGEFGQQGSTHANADPPNNELTRMDYWGIMMNQGMAIAWPDRPCGSNESLNLCIGTQQQAQLANISTFFRSVPGDVTSLTITTTSGGTGSQTISCYGLSDSTEVAGYCVNRTNRSTVHNATISLTLPTTNMALIWMLPSNGTVVATSTVAGSGTQTLTIPDFSSSVQTGDIAFRLRATTSPSVMSSMMPGSLINTAYSYQINAAGGAGTYSYRISSGALPNGVNLNAATGIISGTPTIAGNWNFFVQAIDKTNTVSAAQKFIMVVWPAITVGQTTLDNYINGQSISPYSAPIVITGGIPPVSCAVTGTPPTGVSYDTACQASGTPSAAGTFTFTVTATDAASNSTGGVTVTQTVPSSTVAIVNGTIPAATLNWPYQSHSFGAVGGTGGNTWSIGTGSLPTGLSLTSSGGNGFITGTPSGTTQTFTLIATSNTSQASSPQSYTLTVNAYPTITTSSLPSYSVGNPYYQAISFTGGTLPITCIPIGALPSGMILDPNLNAITGTSTDTGTLSVTIACKDSNGAPVSQSYFFGSAVNSNPEPSLIVP